MKTILEAKKSIAQLWGAPKPKDTVYRLMNYLLQIDADDGILLHNNVTGHLVKLTDEEAKEIRNLPIKPTEHCTELIANHFLVPVDFDEYRSVKQLRKVFQNRSNGETINHFVILPTTYCNARCFYCYESGYPHVHMTKETADKVIEYIVAHRKDKKVRLAWFGGEPLLGIERIDQISQGLKDRDIPFYSSMISNGYLFDEDIVKRCVELWKLEQVQITLDGNEEVYNKVKAYVNAGDNPYQRVHRNIELLSKKKISVVIRLNLDFYNRQAILELMEELAQRYLGNEHVRVYLSLLYNDQGFEPIHHNDDEYLELLEIYDDYTQRLLELGMAQDRRRAPYLITRQCMADDKYSVMIQPDGSLCRCEHECVNDSYGSITEGVKDPLKPKQWMVTVDRSEQCPNCCMYPFCYLLKGCLGADVPCTEGVQQNFQKKHIDKLKNVYQKSQEDEKNERI